MKSTINKCVVNPPDLNNTNLYVLSSPVVYLRETGGGVYMCAPEIWAHNKTNTRIGHCTFNKSVHFC